MSRVLMNQSAMKDPVIAAVLKDMHARNFEPLPTPLPGTWHIGQRLMEILIITGGAYALYTVGMAIATHLDCRD